MVAVSLKKKKEMEIKGARADEFGLQHRQAVPIGVGLTCLSSILYDFFYFLFIRRGYGMFFFFFQAEDGIRDLYVTGVQTCALPISWRPRSARGSRAGRSASGRL